MKSESGKGQINHARPQSKQRVEFRIAPKRIKDLRAKNINPLEALGGRWGNIPP